MCTFGPFLGKQEFSQKIRLRQGNPEKNAAVTGQQINWGIFHIFGQARIFSKDLTLSIFRTYGPRTSYKISEKPNDPIPRKNVAVMDEQKNQGILGHFGLFSGKRTFSQKNLTLSVLSTYGPSTSCKI